MAKSIRKHENETGLPQWAQERLKDYRREIETLHTRLVAAAEGTHKSPFFYTFFDASRVREIPPFYIPRHVRLQHCNDGIDGRGVLEFQAGDSVDGGSEWVRVYAHDGTIHVQPVAANVIKIKVERHR